MVRTKSLEMFVGCSCPKYRNFVPKMHFPCDMRIEYYVSPKRELHLQAIIPNPNTISVRKSLSYQVTLVDTNGTKPNSILPDRQHHKRHIHHQAKYHISDSRHKHITYDLTHHFECTTNHSDFYPVAVP
jgi:hypothetical protein